MKFGIVLPGASPLTASRWDQGAIARGMVETAKLAERLGYDFVGSSDHVVIPKASARLIPPRWYDPVATLGFVAGGTKRVRLLTSIVVVPYRNPFTMAKSIATLDVLSRGRVIFGAGVGHLKAEFDALGVPYAERGPRTDEYLEIMKRLWSEEAVTYQGRFYSCRDMMLEPKPLQKPLPIWIGGNSRAAAERAGRLGDGWHPHQHDLEELPDLIAAARERANGRSLDIAGALGPIARHPDAVRRRSPEEIERRARELAGDSEFHRDVVRRNLASVSLTSKDQAVEDVGHLQGFGMTHLWVRFAFREMSHLTEAMEWFAEEVMPDFS